MSYYNPELNAWTPEALKKKHKVMCEMRENLNETVTSIKEFTDYPYASDNNKLLVLSALQLNILCAFMNYQLTKDSEEFDELVAKVMTEEEAEKFYKELEEETTKNNEPPEETKTGKGKDPCDGQICYEKLEGDSYSHRCDDCTHTYNMAERRHYFDCALKSKGVGVPDKDVVNGLRILPSAFNEEEEVMKNDQDRKL